MDRCCGFDEISCTDTRYYTLKYSLGCERESAVYVDFAGFRITSLYSHLSVRGGVWKERNAVVLFYFCPLWENPDLINSSEFCELLLVFNSSFAHALDIRTEFMLPAHAFICFAVWIGVRVCPQTYSRPTFLPFCSVSGFLTSSAPPLEYHSRDCVFMVWVIF